MARVEYHTGLQKKVIITIVLLLQWWSSHGCTEEERAALLQLQRSFSYPNGIFQRPWELNIDCCEWEGVVCNDTTGRVNELWLQNSRDESLGEWKFNASVFLPFQQLKSLDLRGNNIVCCVENEGFEGLQRLSYLELLYLSHNNLTNNVLLTFHGFQSLKNLSLSYNKLSGSIYVKDLVNILNLEELRLNGNNIEKFVSYKDIDNSSSISILWLTHGVCNGSSFELQSLKVFKNLKSIHLEYNNFKGVLFPQDELNKLEELFLDGSDVDENFLLSLGALQSLRLLSLGSINYETLNIQSFPNFKNLELLDLNHNVVGNSFLQSIANITSLQALGLIGCQLNDNIDELCKMKNLRWLDLGDNNISGTLPPCLSNLTLLRHLNLSSNHLTRDLSAYLLKNLTSIEYLDISNNQFQIPISLSPFFNHSKLKYLIAHGNEVYADSGGVDNNLNPQFQLEVLSLSSTYGEGGVSYPRFLHHQHNLRYLNIFGIQMKGAGFPSWLLDNNTNLEFLSLINCSLSGTLHLPIHRRPKLDYLDISFNLFYGHIPAEIGRYFPMLYRFFLRNNNFIGKIPNSLSNCSMLQALIMSDNGLFGKIPEWFGNMSSLLILELSNNNFFGSLPSMFMPPQALHVLLSYNRLEGTFPYILPNYRLLTLDLSYNYLTGDLPNSMKNLYWLTNILLNHNKFEGEIPAYLWKMMNGLKFVDLSYNRLSTFSFKKDTLETSHGSGCEFDDNGFLELVEKRNINQYGVGRMYHIGFIGLDLSNNNLTCSIPYEIGNKEGMKTLNLSHNNLRGHIPLSFSNMTEVESLDLSYNNLSGIIPPKLIQLKSLEVFSVAYNNISGKTPERIKQFATFEEDSYRGNPFLCGLPLPNNCTPTESLMTNDSLTSDSDNQNDGFIDMEAFQISFWFYFIEVIIISCYYFLVDRLPFLSKIGIT
ncbi:hypothetical protein K2173_017731 [Erythroxylum novogranatense]|uniref:Leucine-rich repeat-containing N-terminal plant-type domain-containing protein n=1 Tax=Erythroxylum novogranatense TaxID=1862640 RepID=A0AAV8SMD5_9ROSI|nr:hypothetical protein K2173_017731 [Erythroxylum novogranatense]